MRKGFLAAVLAALIGGVLLNPASAAVKAGTACTKAGLTSVSAGIKYTCIKSGKKLVWDKGVKISSTGSAPAPAPKPSASSNVANVQIPEVSPETEFAPASDCKIVKGGNNPDIFTGFPRDQKYIPSSGNRKSIVFFVDFPDLPADPRAITVWKQTLIPYAQKAFMAMSYGKYQLAYEMNEKFFHLSIPYASYIKNEAGNLPGSVPAQALDTNKLLNDALRIADPEIDFSQYDFVNVVTPTFKPKTEGGASGGGGFNVDGKTSFLATLGPIDEYLDDATKKNWLLHETGHLLGLNHIYAGAKGPAGWDVMGNVFGNDDLLGWNKFVLGWIGDNQVHCIVTPLEKESIHLLTPVGTESNSTKLAIIKLSQTKAIVVEVRRKTDIDNLSQADSGVIVYTLDTTVPDNQGAINIVSNPMKYGFDTRRNRVLLGSMDVGESVTTQGFTVRVIASVAAGDYVSISKA